MTAELLIDSQIRDWVLVPIFVILFLITAARHYAARWMRSDNKPKKSAVSENQILLKARLLRENGGFLPSSAFRAHRAFLIAKEHGGALHRDASKPNPMDMKLMGDQMKNSISAMAPQLAMMGLISFFFSGFIIAKLPFSPSVRFRPMLQRGVDLQSLDMSYVTSISLYVLVMFGSQGLFNLLLGQQDNAADMMKQQQAMMMPMMGAQQPQVDMSKVFQGERENLELMQHTFELKTAESKLLSRSK